ncbi:hypothetical protein [Cytophaga sp. FL35]|uniref:hypothetical protein n=1 Tax=Cytophaga sp. FL35 TaxID=1904456 RepID=UPI00165344EF|nr:hypothetical protein [Cytophaga sp. FL35]MBC7000890.1 hypothetical protein [Cytophaga sp. FL35]
MKKNIIDKLNKILINTLDYKEVLGKLASSITHGATGDKLKELAEVADRESKSLVKIISDIGGNVESTERKTDQESIYWVSRPLPNAQDMQEVLPCLIEAERSKEKDYNEVIGHEDIQRETANQLGKHRKEAEATLRYFQTIEAQKEKT